MRLNILLLDCSIRFCAKLKQQGFDVDTGTIGFCTGIRSLPCQVYEKDILIYNPSSIMSGPNGRDYISEDDIQDHTPEYNLIDVYGHFKRGATMLVFVNHVANDIKKQNEAYKWIPFMPKIDFTKDHKIHVISALKEGRYKFLTPIISPTHIKMPVLQKLHWLAPLDGQGSVPLIQNRNCEMLSTFLERGEGKLIILPECQSNEEVISTFLHRVVPKLCDLETRSNLMERFISPQEKQMQDDIEKIQQKMAELNEAVETGNEKLNSARRNKIQTIKQDETAIRIFNYYDLATQQDDVALFYLYKVIEALENKYGGEKESKTKLGCNTEWNLIGKLANVSYADIRHAPKPGEKIKEWAQEEIKECFKAAEEIIHAYLATLF